VLRPDHSLLDWPVWSVLDGNVHSSCLFLFRRVVSFPWGSFIGFLTETARERVLKVPRVLPVRRFFASD